MVLFYKPPWRKYALCCDNAAKKLSYTTKSYIDVLDRNLVKIYKKSMVFMQDNAPIHSAGMVKIWLENKKVNVMEWPPYSPDLNPIEHAWSKLKEELNKKHPELETLPGGPETVREQLQVAAAEVWKDLKSDYFERLSSTMKNRCLAVIEAEGWYTKY